jgi:hypothetical protein
MKVSIADPVQEVSISACRCVNLANVNSQSSKAPDRQDLSLESGVAFWPCRIGNAQPILFCEAMLRWRPLSPHGLPFSRDDRGTMRLRKRPITSVFVSILTAIAAASVFGDEDTPGTSEPTAIPTKTLVYKAKPRRTLTVYYPDGWKPLTSGRHWSYFGATFLCSENISDGLAW